jgi:hypothetical protein
METSLTTRSSTERNSKEESLDQEGGVARCSHCAGRSNSLIIYLIRASPLGTYLMRGIFPLHYWKVNGIFHNW